MKINLYMGGLDIPTSVRKKIIMTKLIFTITCIFCFQGYANKLNAQKIITLSVKEQKLKEVLKQVEFKTHSIFIYKDESLNNFEVKELHLNKTPLDLALEQILVPFNLSFKRLDDNRYVISANQQPNLHIQGRVVDQDGKVLPYVSVYEVNTENTSTTDKDGYFLLRVSSMNPLIKISHIGYQTFTAVINYQENAAKTKQNKFNFSIILEQKVSTLDSVDVSINTGYQVLPKDRSTGSFTFISGNELQQKSGSMNVVDRLEGLVPGLAVNYGDGNDKLLLRGVTTVNLNRQPLVVLDGVPMAEYTDLESLVNATDVQDITVLKDATASSIWGAQAANGVIVITTKNGQYNSDKIKIVYDGMVSIKGRTDYGYLDYMNSKDFIATFKELSSDANYLQAFPLTTITNTNFPVIYPHEQIFYDLASNTIDAKEANTSWSNLSMMENRKQIEKYFQQASVWTSHNLTLSGGGQKNKFYTSVGYLRQDNTDKTYKDRYNFLLKEDWALNAAIDLDASANISYEKYIDNNWSFPTSLDSYLPYAMFADDNGAPIDQTYLYMTEDYQQAATSKSLLPLNYTPLQQINTVDNDNNKLIARLNAGIRIKLYDGLNLTARGQYQKSINDGYTFKNEDNYAVQLQRIQFTQGATTTGGSPTYYLPIDGGDYTTMSNKVTSWTARGQFDYTKMIDTDHQISALAGMETRSTTYDIRNTLTKGYDMQTLTYSNFDANTLQTTGVSNAVLPLANRTGSTNTLQYKPLTTAESQLRFVSFYANAAYAYKSKYNFNGSIRFDRSNLFGQATSSQNNPIWSTGLSWNLHKESFFPTDLVNELTLRATYGISGNSPTPGLGGTYDILYAINDSFFDGLGTGYIVISPANDKLTWEKTKSINLGADFALLKNRLKGSVDLYRKNTSDLLGEVLVDPTSGWTTAYGNLGKLYNQGIEISLQSANIAKDHFAWSTRFNISYNKNKITALKTYNSPSALQKAASTFIEGYSAYSLFGTKYTGLNSEGNPQVYGKDGQLINLSTNLTTDDIYYQGSTQPLWSGGMTNLVTYRDWNLSFLLIYNFGNVMRNNLNTFFSGRLTSNISNTFANRWKEPGDEQYTNIPKYIPNQTDSDNDRSTSLYQYADANVISASYLKLRDLTLTYNLPTSTLLKNLKVSHAKIHGQVNNIMVWTKNKEDIDPEYYNLSSGYKTPRMSAFYTLGINLTF